jgi:hypothetical protein
VLDVYGSGSVPPIPIGRRNERFRQTLLYHIYMALVNPQNRLSRT